jgi:Toprim domain
MVARVDLPTGESVGVHRTYLCNADGGTWHRLEGDDAKLSLGPIGGGAVQLAPAAATLLAGEGIESVLSAMILTGLPGWAGLSTSGLKAMILPAIVQNVVIVADHDENGAGQAAARKAGLRWAGEGRRVRVITPNHVGSDANDLLRGGAP